MFTNNINVKIPDQVRDDEYASQYTNNQYTSNKYITKKRKRG